MELRINPQYHCCQYSGGLRSVETQSCQPWKLNHTLLRVLTSQASWSQSPSQLLSCFPFGSSFAARLSSLLSHFHWLLDVSSEMGNVCVAFLYGFKQLTKKISKESWTLVATESSLWCHQGERQETWEQEQSEEPIWFSFQRKPHN